MFLRQRLAVGLHYTICSNAQMNASCLRLSQQTYQQMQNSANIFYKTNGSEFICAFNYSTNIQWPAMSSRKMHVGNQTTLPSTSIEQNAPWEETRSRRIQCLIKLLHASAESDLGIAAAPTRRSDAITAHQGRADPPPVPPNTAGKFILAHWFAGNLIKMF